MLYPENYLIIVSLFPRLLAFIYFAAFGAFIFQIRGLLGEDGILPVKNLLARIRGRNFLNFPTIFWFNSTDAMLMAVAITGTVLSILVMLGIYPIIFLPVMFFLYMSIILVGQDFLSFGWETLLLEITYYAILMSWTTVPNLLIWWAVNFLIFRFHFLAGVIKWKAHDPAWRNLTALCYHYQSQPIPNTQAYYAHKLPVWFQKFSTAMLFVCEVIVPFGIFGPDWLRFLTFFGFFGLQFMIWFTGNFSFLNHMTVVMISLLLSDRFLAPIFGMPEAPATNPLLLEGVLSVAGFFLIVVQVIRILSHFFTNSTFEKILRAVWPYFLAHWHAIFAHMTKTRYEVVVEGSDDGEVWKEYGFWYKPTELDRRPRRISPYQPRLDWMMWFLPFDYYEHQFWFQRFLVKLKEGAPHVLKLIRVNPFPEAPPKHVRAVLYDYEYTDLGEKNWWKRKYVGPYS